jgi:PEGA domain
MTHHRGILGLFIASLIACAVGSLPIQSLGQKRGEAVVPGSAPARPKRGEAIIEKEDSPESKPNKEVKIKVVTSSEGALVLWIVSDATVTLTSLRNKNEGPPRNYDLGQGNKLTIPLISPGRYKISVSHPDYILFTDTITIVKGAPTALAVLPLLVSKYGSINVVGAPPGAKILLNGKGLDPANIKLTGEAITIDRVPVGKHQLKISKEGYDDLNKPLEVFPGKQTPFSAKLDSATVTVIFDSEPGAKLYVNNEEKGTVQADRKVKVSLPPGSYQVQLTKDGYEDWKKEIALSLEQRTVAESIPLTPTPESTEGDWTSEYGSKRWTSGSRNWKFDNTGARINGDAAVLYKTEEKREFNFYRGFTLTIHFQFDGKGAAWVARAKDRNNYYLFELNGLQSANPGTLIFYIYRDGVPRELDRKKVPGKLAKDDQFRITLEARGAQFIVWLYTNSNPTSDSKGNKIGIFQDEAFSIGGVGFRGKDGTEMLLKSFNVLTVK